MSNEYRVNVPSYKRANVVKERTLAFLDGHNIDRERVTVWVADEQELDEYRNTLDPSWNIAISAPGLVQSRCVYHNAFAEGTPIVNIDDDVSALLVSDGKRLHPYSGSLNKFIETAFTTADDNHVRLWGVNGAANAMFLKPQATVGLRYIIGAFFGSYAGDPIFNIANRDGVSSGEDFEATLMAFSRDGAVLRFDGITPKTAYFAAGGIDAELKDRNIPNRQDEHCKRLQALAARFPGIASTYTKAGGVTNIRLKTITAHRLEWRDF